MLLLYKASRGNARSGLVGERYLDHIAHIYYGMLYTLPLINMGRRAQLITISVLREWSRTLIRSLILA